MKRSLFRPAAVLLLMAVMPAAAQAPAHLDPEFTKRILAMEVSWDKFVRHFFGCPEDPALIADAATCKPLTGRLDTKEFSDARRAAAKLFDLRE